MRAKQPGLPNNNYFPFDTLESKVALSERWEPTKSKADSKPSMFGYMASKQKKADPKQPESHLFVPHTETTTDMTRKIDLDTALQYGTAQGYPPLFTFVKEFATKYLHPSIPYADGADVILTCGNTDGLSKTLQCLQNEWHEGDPIEEKTGLLVEKFAYMNAVQAAKPRGMNIVPVEIDEEGMLAEGPGGLKDVLENWDFARGKMPHLMYTVT
jgi:DNA-binding transcriptional MocR family regulator